MQAATPETVLGDFRGTTFSYYGVTSHFFTQLENRANELAGTTAKALFVMTEFGAVRERLGTPPALPGEEFECDEDNSGLITDVVY